jgi:hypothetical protein
MKKYWMILNCVLVLTILLTACGSQNNTDAASTNSTVTSNQNGEFILPLQTQLIIGTFALEKSDYAVTKEQAQELLPLWKVLKNLLTSDSASNIEIDALVNQIQDTMTEQQLAYISDQVTSQESYQSILSEYMPEGTQLGNFGSMTDEERQAMRETAVASGGGQFPGGSIPEGGFQGGGGGQFAGGSIPEGGFQGGVPGSGFDGGTVSGTPQANSGGRGGGQTNSVLLEVLIQLLSEK